MEYEHEEVYRGVRFYKTKKGFWLFASLPKFGTYWQRYFTDDELRSIDEKIMRTAIDRMLNNNIVYTGDIRERVL